MRLLGRHLYCLRTRQECVRAVRTSRHASRWLRRLCDSAAPMHAPTSMRLSAAACPQPALCMADRRLPPLGRDRRTVGCWSRPTSAHPTHQCTMTPPHLRRPTGAPAPEPDLRCPTSGASFPLWLWLTLLAAALVARLPPAPLFVKEGLLGIDPPI